MPVDIDPLAGPKGGDKGRKLASFWKDQIDSIHDSPLHKRWVKRGETIEKRYRDERNRADEDGQRRYNALWANVEILKPALYGKCPVPVAERRFKDRDPAGRGAAQMIERALRNELEICGFDDAMQQAVSDYLLPGRGVVWVRYEPEIGSGPSLPILTETDEDYNQGKVEPAEETPSEDKLEATSDRVIRESTPVDFVPWEDFLTFPVRARSWKEVTGIGKRVYLSRDQMVERFGKVIGKGIPLEKDDRGLKGRAETSTTDIDGEKGVVYEIWDREHEEVVWVAMGYEWLVDRKDDFLKLESFFPTPRPLYANATNNTLVPVPDYIQYQDQAIQVDELTQRIAMLTKACKMTGVYNAAAKDIQRLFDESVENQLIPVSDWAAFAGDGGGVEGNISFMPIQVIKDCINELMMVKEKQILEMDRLTGITDIMRGTTDARETLGGQRLKTNSAGTRLQKRQNEVARFARDTVRIMADIMCLHFSPQSLIEVSGALFEEGLGPADMPDLTALHPGAAPSGNPPPVAGPLGGAGLHPQPQAGPAPIPPGPPPGLPAGPGMPPGAPVGAPPGLPPGAPPMMQGGPPVTGQPPGQDVVPFRPPGAPPALNGQVLPPLPPEFAPPPPPIPPEMIEKLKAAARIAKALDLLRDERLRGFRVDIEVDSTIYGDSEQDKADRTQFIGAVAQFLEKSVMLSMQVPEIAPLMGKMLQFGVRGFRVGRDLELAVEEFTDEAGAAAKGRAEALKQQPNPQLLSAQAAMLKAQTDAGSQKQQSMIDMATAQADIHGQQLENESAQIESAAEIERQKVENQGEIINSIADLVMRQIDLKMKEKDLQMKDKEMESQEYKAKVDAHTTGYKAKVDAHKQRIQAAKTTESSVAKTPKMPPPPKPTEPPERPDATEEGLSTDNLMQMLQQVIGQMTSTMTAPIDLERDHTGRVVGGRRRMF